MKRLVKLLIAILVAVGGWILYFLSGFFKRDEKKIVFGTHTGTFSGNVKSLYLDASYKEKYQKIFIYKNEKIKVSLEKLNGEHLFFSVSSIKGIYHILTAKQFVYSSYVSDINYWLSRGAILFNVWHGTPLKKIERDVTTGFYSIRNKYEFIFKYIFPHLYVCPDKLLVCSEYEKQCFRTAFGVQDSTFVEAFPPRLKTLKDDYQVALPKNLVIYAPTWRDDASFQFYKSCELDKLNALMAEKNLICLVKPHPSDKTQHLDKEYSNIKPAELSEDFYDLVKYAKFVITDYSSVMFDCMYCDIPVILFCPDLDNYLKNSREFYCDINVLPFSLTRLSSELLEFVRSESYINKENKMFYPYDNNL
ncbi:CDP-glycerol glycerophosphotransferase family protein [Rodentibacter ratti]|uniref:CDP-glycerol glycerophosphotransferase n=1 Tax=Rodentibacter ratti TaxID=1906745 RepID=A0A1V3L872_9PAST|nr:CDP-glycerol glycerophosphotransferase family protein [Rodentibacter ratti]OOF86126.1 CDP-glycerol glycerophosphotransferase [Rodentibacter ratti]